MGNEFFAHPLSSDKSPRGRPLEIVGAIVREIVRAIVGTNPEVGYCPMRPSEKVEDARLGPRLLPFRMVSPP